MPYTRLFLTLAAGALLATMVSTAIAAIEPGTPAFKRTWERTDRPVASGEITRTWIWGPQPFTGLKEEDYIDAPGNKRVVQYFDKSRMEINNPDGDESSPWYVTNGLLARELMTGMLQTGDEMFAYRPPAEIPVAGDPINNPSPTYATLGTLMDEPALSNGEEIILRLNQDGTVTLDESMADPEVTAYRYVAETGHQVAKPFWYFMTSEAPVYEDGQMVSEYLFEDPFYATGLPLTEAYWVTATVGGEETDVLIQCFERRCLTYTPSNVPGWQIETGNVGRHYYEWRYDIDLDAAQS